MFAKAILVSIIAFALLLVISQTESGVLPVQKQIITMILCPNQTCNGKSGSKDSFTLRLPCRDIQRPLRTQTKSLKLQSSPKFASCIVLYNGPQCTGTSMTINNGTEIDLATVNSENTSFDRSNIASWELCIAKEFRNDASFPRNQIPENNAL